MKEDVILVNTSRGEIFNEKDLYKWLVQNNNAIAALDVFENEPYDWNSGLSILKNVIMTPHIGSYTKKARHKMETEAIKNIQNA
jgi:phosphoglycerate dehydrogenase-like enzyme